MSGRHRGERRGTDLRPSVTPAVPQKISGKYDFQNLRPGSLCTLALLLRRWAGRGHKENKFGRHREYLLGFAVESWPFIRGIAAKVTSKRKVESRRPMCDISTCGCRDDGGVCVCYRAAVRGMLMSQTHVVPAKLVMFDHHHHW